MNVYVLYLTTGIPPSETDTIVQAVFSSLEEAGHYLNTHPFIHIYKPCIKECYMILPKTGPYS